MMLHPLMLAWVAGAVVPLVLHLLSRSQYRPQPWGAMMFLTGDSSGPHYAARVRQWTLLLLRMGLVGLLAIALARPVIAARYSWIPSAGLTTAGPAAVVIILDDSASMGYQRDGQSRLDQARQVTLQILSSLKRGDEATLLLAGTRDYQAPLPPSADFQSIATRVEDIESDTGESDFATDLLRANELLQQAEPSNHQIYVVCDRQALSWRNLTDGFRRQWRSLQKTAPSPRLTIIPVGGTEADNISVNAIDLPDHACIANQQTVAQVSIRNYGPAPVNDVPLSVWTGNRSLCETTISIPAHAARTLNIPFRAGDAGSRVISAAVKSTGFTTDDRLDYSVDVLEPQRVLLITPSAPTTTRPVGSSPIPLITRLESFKATDSVATAAIAQFTGQSLKNIQEVILDEDARFSADQMQSLRQFVRSGGEVLILPGNFSTADDYNHSLFSAGGLLHATLRPPAISPRRLGKVEWYDAMFQSMPDVFRPDVSHPGPASPGFLYFPLVTSAKILARYTTNEPALIESNLDSGRVVFFNAIVDFAHPPATVAPMLQAILRHLATASAADRNLSPGQPIVAMLNDPVDDRSTSVQFHSGGSREPITPIHQGDRTEIRFTHTARPGLYRLRYRTGGKERTLNYVVRPSRSDADLTPLTEEQWQAMHDRVRFDRIDLSQTTVAQAIDSRRGGREIWIELISGVLLLMALETLLSRWWTS